MDASVSDLQPVLQSEDIELRLLLEAIYHRYHYDFRDYAMASIKRRLNDARQHFRCHSFSMLQDLILRDSSCLPSLLDFLTVQVSEMFRDPNYYRALRERVIPHLRTYPSLNVWVAGCSNGEELYSLAILFREEGLDLKTTFYGTDINDTALTKAARGVYPLCTISGFTKNHQLSGAKSSLSDYYTTGYNRAIFDKSLKRRMVFSKHSLATDVVFAEMHLISCRNVIIYFNKQLQDRVIELFKDALCPMGFLGIGAKESLRFSEHNDQFAELHETERIYQKLGGWQCPLSVPLVQA
jgi:chemotaxis protein methyltransferase CheR